jgi:hypothetical protein
VFIDISIAKNSNVFIVVENHTIEDLRKVLDNLNEKNFNAYLSEVTRYDCIAYQTAICDLYIKYRESLSKLNACSDKFNSLKKSYTNSWTKELIATFGTEYVSQHIEDIKNLIINISVINRSNFCIDNEKDGLYVETQYIITVREYFKYYLSYYETLNPKKKQEFIQQKKIADDVLKSMSVYPFQIMLYGGHISSYLDVGYHIDLKPEVIKFLVNHKDLSNPFDPVVAFKNLLSVHP